MIVIFDLDDTLFSRSSFVRNGIKNVSNLIYFKNKFLNRNIIYKELVKLYYSYNQKKIFNYYLKKNSIKNISVQECVKLFRYGQSPIKVFAGVKKLLTKFNKKCYLVTDGNKLVQKNKIKLLKIKSFFKKIFITNAYGIKYQKPSLYCFEKIKKLEKCKYSEMIYIGDNPKKDFVNCNKVGIATIRVLSGEYRNLKISKKFDAKYKVKNIIYIDKILNLFS